MCSSNFIPLILFALMLQVSCKNSDPNRKEQEENKMLQTKDALQTMKKTAIQGHRGCRGLMPENSIPAFIKALELGITTLELDVVITKDKKVVISHEPWLSHQICKDPQGNPIKNDKAYNIYDMTYKELKACDCGQRPHPRFPNQKKLAVSKPLLSDLIDSVNAYAQKHQIKDIWYNIEIKRQPEYDGKFCPPVEEFVDLVLAVIQEKEIEKSCNLQSFDWEVLRLSNAKAKDIPLAMLVENSLSPQQNLDELGFQPEIYSCYFKLIDNDLLNWIEEKEMQLIPWTVNEEEDIKTMLQLPLDGIITDYPDRVLKLIEDH